MAKLERVMEFVLPCGEEIFASRGSNSNVWRVDTGGIPTTIDLSRRNAEAIIEMIRELSKNTPRGIRE